jgi:hypothetical protein
MWGRPVFKEKQGHREQQGLKGPLELKDLRDQKEIVGTWDLRVFKVMLVLKV